MLCTLYSCVCVCPFPSPQVCSTVSMKRGKVALEFVEWGAHYSWWIGVCSQGGREQNVILCLLHVQWTPSNPVTLWTSQSVLTTGGVILYCRSDTVCCSKGQGTPLIYSLYYSVLHVLFQGPVPIPEVCSIMWMTCRTSLIYGRMHHTLHMSY